MIIRGLVSFLRNYFSDQKIYIILIVLAVSIVTIAWNVIMWSIYVGKVPFFEQYRCNPQVFLKLGRNYGHGNKTSISGEKRQLRAFC